MLSRQGGPYRPGKYQTRQSAHDAARPEHAKRDAYDWATLWVATVGVFIVAVSAIIQAWTALQGQEQVEATRQQVALMAAQQRPWLAPDMPKDGFLLLSENGFVVGFDLPVKNAGEVAATEVRTDATIMGDNINGPVLDYSEASLTHCRMEPVGPADALFPGETKNVGVVATADLRKLRNVQHTVSGKRYLTPVVVGCITYRSAADGKLKRTPFAYRVIDKNWKTAGRDWRISQALPYGDRTELDFDRPASGAANPN